MSICLTKHLQKCNEHKDVGMLLKYTLDLSEKHMEEIHAIFSKENIPIPQGFTGDDVDLTAPALFF